MIEAPSNLGELRWKEEGEFDSDEFVMQVGTESPRSVAILFGHRKIGDIIWTTE